MSSGPAKSREFDWIGYQEFSNSAQLRRIRSTMEESTVESQKNQAACQRLIEHSIQKSTCASRLTSSSDWNEIDGNYLDSSLCIAKFISKLIWLSDPTVKFMIEALAKAGCPVTEKFFKSENCTMEAGGGFVPQIGVRSTALTTNWADQGWLLMPIEGLNCSSSFV